uniref:Putative secreted protein n=1 Tax=Anopheles triannulatus TaxID=58253 RepID=A0A2M4B7A9_9DIPT
MGMMSGRGPGPLIVVLQCWRVSCTSPPHGLYQIQPLDSLSTARRRNCHPIGERNPGRRTTRVPEVFHADETAARQQK